MTDTFNIQTPFILRVWLLTILLIALTAVALFNLPFWPKIAMLMIVICYGIWLIYNWWHHSPMFRFHYLSNHWTVFIQNSGWVSMQSVRPIYVSDHLIWLNFYKKDRSLITMIVGSDSVSAANYLQLRRCVICPAALITRSA